MTDFEITWDKRLQIKTTGRDDSSADQYRYPYEPTPYTVLERLVNSGLIREGDVVLDYGCGKGRVGFFLSYQTQDFPCGKADLFLQIGAGGDMHTFRQSSLSEETVEIFFF